MIWLLLSGVAILYNTFINSKWIAHKSWLKGINEAFSNWGQGKMAAILQMTFWYA